MKIHKEILETFPGLSVAEGNVGPLSIQEKIPSLEALRDEVIRSVREQFTLERVKDEPIFRAYRDFFWRVGVDPTKTRPASEALVRRILAGKMLPTINTAVGAYNLASIRTGIPIAAFDADTLAGDLAMRFAEEGEEFLGIGMAAPVLLHKNQVVLEDGNAIVAVYPYRDSDATKITLATKVVHIVACGVPGVESGKVPAAYDLAAEYLQRYAPGIL